MLIYEDGGYCLWLFVVNPRWRKLHPLSSGFRRSHQKRRLIWEFGRVVEGSWLEISRRCWAVRGFESYNSRQCTPFVMFTFVRILVMLDLLSLWKTIRLQAVFFGRGVFIWSSTQVAIRGRPAKALDRAIGARVRISPAPPCNPDGCHGQIDVHNNDGLNLMHTTCCDKLIE